MGWRVPSLWSGSAALASADKVELTAEQGAPLRPSHHLHRVTGHRLLPGNEWFTIESNKTGTRWTGKVWYVHEMVKYEFDLEFELPVAYPNVSPELALPELDGKTEKMYRGGKICLDAHFRPLWARNVPHFGVAHEIGRAHV